MKLIKHKQISDARYLCQKSSFIEDYWLSIKDNNLLLGTFTGYRIPIPYLLNDILTNKDSEIDFESVSDLCYDLWKFLNNHPEILENKNGYLYFLNNIHIDPEYCSSAIEKDAFTILQNKMDIIIYSIGVIEPFDPYLKNDWSRDNWEQHKKLLIENNWVPTNDEKYFIYEKAELQKQKYRYNSLTTIKETPFEHWVKSKGLDWAQSLWKSIINDNRFERNWQQLKKKSLEIPKNEIGNSIDPVHFLKHFKIFDFKQYDPATRNAFEASKNASYLRDEGLIIKYNNFRYQIYYSKCLINNTMFHNISFGVYDEIDQLYVVNNARTIFAITVYSGFDEYFIHFFKIIFNQYQVELQNRDNIINLFQNEHTKRNYLF
ncbi:hypothetical protein [Bacillus cereus]|uniref:hypothetical protein n=1 Tax=Bacillus cereus TaxID=1396 RepID=UPI000B4C03C2|nr:hypothetical protein [Bacillus cereus]